MNWWRRTSPRSLRFFCSIIRALVTAILRVTIPWIFVSKLLFGIQLRYGKKSLQSTAIAPIIGSTTSILKISFFVISFPSSSTKMDSTSWPKACKILRKWFGSDCQHRIMQALTQIYQHTHTEIIDPINVLFIDLRVKNLFLVSLYYGDIRPSKHPAISSLDWLDMSRWYTKRNYLNNKKISSK